MSVSPPVLSDLAFTLLLSPYNASIVEMLRQFIESTQYAGAHHQGLLKKYGLIGSTSRKGNCWHNAVMERFFLSLKMEWF